MTRGARNLRDEIEDLELRLTELEAMFTDQEMRLARLEFSGEAQRVSSFVDEIFQALLGRKPKLHEKELLLGQIRYPLNQPGVHGESPPIDPIESMSTTSPPTTTD